MRPVVRPSRLLHMTHNQTRSKRRPSRIYLPYQNGQFRIHGLDDWYTHWREPYYLMLTVPWPGFILVSMGAYTIINAVFAVLYLLGGDGIANAQPGSFWDAFFFSVQTLGAIGYGAMYPTTPYANAIVAIEAFTSILCIALLTGLAFARFSQPSARVIFSDALVIHQYNGYPTLMLRTANQRRNQILEAKLELYLMRDEISREGAALRRVYTLNLVRGQTPSFSLPWTVMHTIDETSPLYGWTPEGLAQTKAMILASMTGVDETVAHALHARKNYSITDIQWGHRFIDLFHETPGGHRVIDFTHFHDTAPET